jgi:hypothetical protein
MLERLKITTAKTEISVVVDSTKTRVQNEKITTSKIINIIKNLNKTHEKKYTKTCPYTKTYPLSLVHLITSQLNEDLYYSFKSECKVLVIENDISKRRRRFWRAYNMSPFDVLSSICYGYTNKTRSIVYLTVAKILTDSKGPTLYVTYNVWKEAYAEFKRYLELDLKDTPWDDVGEDGLEDIAQHIIKIYPKYSLRALIFMIMHTDRDRNIMISLNFNSNRLNLTSNAFHSQVITHQLSRRLCNYLLKNFELSINKRSIQAYCVQEMINNSCMKTNLVIHDSGVCYIFKFSHNPSLVANSLNRRLQKKNPRYGMRELDIIKFLRGPTIPLNKNFRLFYDGKFLDTLDEIFTLQDFHLMLFKVFSEDNLNIKLQYPTMHLNYHYYELEVTIPALPCDEFKLLVQLTPGEYQALLDYFNVSNKCAFVA